MARQKPILVIDDDPDLCSMLKKALEHDGHDVVTAKNGMEAIREYELNRPRLLFVDLMMPSLDGEEFLRVLGDPRPPVVLVTASVRREEVAERFGVEESVEKPFDINVIRKLAKRFAGDPEAA
jgi:CheY-like chemotaxis protein